MSVFIVVFLKAERLVVLGFPDVLRNQRSEVPKKFSETFRKRPSGERVADVPERFANHRDNRRIM